MKYKHSFFYRPEIDGLRAISVGAVILYHAQIIILNQQVFKGGFIGVDLFFVISGYLITSIILKELIMTNNFSFKYFYQRRIRRILPILLLVMLATLPIAWIYLPPNSYVGFSKSVLSSLGFISNFYFHYSGQQYGADSSLLKPFLHTWSLSVEEQYYILFPIILFITFKYLKKYIIHILIFGFIGSLGLADWTNKYYHSASFYFLQTRMWELLAGSILAYFEITFGHRHRGKYQILNLIFPSLGILLIGHSFLLFDSSVHQPLLYKLSPIIGVCLIIWFSHKDELITKILSSRIFVFIGLISYSLYLWHYPIFTFARIVEFNSESLFKKILVVIILLFLSIASYYFIEKPARNKNYKSKYIFIFIFIAYCFLIIFNSNIILREGYKKRFFSSDNYRLKLLAYGNINDHIFFETSYNYDDYNNRQNVLIVGNSHGEDILKILSKTNLKNKIYFNLTSPRKRNSDYNFQIIYLYDFLKNERAVIDGSSVDFLNHLKKQYDKSELIILATRFQDTDIKILDELIKILKKDNKKIIIFDNALEQKNIGSVRVNRLIDYILKNPRKYPDEQTLKDIEKKMFLDLENTKDINLKIHEISKKNKIPLIERMKIFCNIIEKRCPSITDTGHKIYWDYAHITEEGADFFARRIEKNKLFLKYLDSALKKNID